MHCLWSHGSAVLACLLGVLHSGGHKSDISNYRVLRCRLRPRSCCGALRCATLPQMGRLPRPLRPALRHRGLRLRRCTTSSERAGANAMRRCEALSGVILRSVLRPRDMHTRAYRCGCWCAHILYRSRPTCALFTPVPSRKDRLLRPMLGVEKTIICRLVPVTGMRSWHPLPKNPEIEIEKLGRNEAQASMPLTSM